ncbi:MAG: peptidoglycan bridge formation glycyltransferase FemA/FemB family protein [bacterium]|nr:peptidoglycan bridge formation glycyltransferase FemA/FemB family protein [bacterium]
MLKIIEITDKDEWNDFINERGGHPLQLWGWGELKAQSPSWQVRRVFLKNSEEKTIDEKKKDHSDIVAAAQILVRKLPFPLRNFAYIPRGSLVLSKKPIERAKLTREIALWAKNNLKPRPVCISMEPDWEEGSFEPTNGWRRAKNTILIPETLILDLTKDENTLLAEMSKKTRQYIRKSSTEVRVREIYTEQEINQALSIYQQTAKRAGFAIHKAQYYQDLKRQMRKNSPIFAAFVRHRTISKNKEGEEVENITEEMVAFLWLAASDKTAFELYGGVSDLGQKVRANYILKWLTIIEMKNRGIERYDFNGLLNDGISKFKAGFSNHRNQLVGTFDFPTSIFYPIWNSMLPAGKKIFRLFKR